MIIFGTTGITSTKGNGQFHCPTCGPEQDYRLRRMRSFFTLYFIPIIPLNKIGDFVECAECKEKFDTKVLDFDPEAVAAELQQQVMETIRRSMALMCLSDGDVDASEIETIRQVYCQLTGIEMSTDEVRQEVAAAEMAGEEVESYLGRISGGLNEHGKEMVVKAALMVAGADGHMDAAESELLGRITVALAMSGAHVKGIIAEMTGSGEEEE